MPWPPLAPAQAQERDLKTFKGQGHAERALNKLARAFLSQMETLKRYRTGGEQKVTMQHVPVSDNAKAIVGEWGVTRRVKANLTKRRPPAARPSPRGTGQRCKTPVVRGWNVFRFHGARGRSAQGQGQCVPGRHGHCSQAATV